MTLLGAVTFGGDPAWPAPEGNGAAHSACDLDGLGFFRAPARRAAARRYPEDGMAVLVVGDLYNERELRRMAGIPSGEPVDGCDLVRALYRARGERFLEAVNGAFVIAVWDRFRRRIFVARDHLGVEPLFYVREGTRLLFASSVHALAASRPRSLNAVALAKTLLFTYNPGADTIFKDVSRLPGGSLLRFSPESFEIRRYWTLRPDTPVPSDERDLAAELRDRMREAVAIRVDPVARPGVFLSGGMDSSSVLAFLRERSSSPLHAFTYRCPGDSFDESHYAKAAAAWAGATYHEAAYGPAEVSRVRAVVQDMDEPFCDSGINITAHLLGQLAGSHVAVALTGDGGDELFAGHPVYDAGIVARYVDRVPSLLKKPFISAFARLPDTARKQDLTVKLKRFSESLAYPSELLSNRWRIFYQMNELRDLLDPGMMRDIEASDPFEDLRAVAAEADDPDPLRGAIHADYRTIVQFFLRRNLLYRRFGLEVRAPLLDPRLVEFCFSVPSRFKRPGWNQSKYILKKSMEPLLPAEIVWRKDKLGHSVPMKNWLRDSRAVRELFLEVLSPASLRRRGLFRLPAVQAMLDDHFACRRNNAHRLWTMVVLELWLRRHVDAFRRAPGDEPAHVLASS